jgi:hypothetical protein
VRGTAAVVVDVEEGPSDIDAAMEAALAARGAGGGGRGDFRTGFLRGPPAVQRAADEASALSGAPPTYGGDTLSSYTRPDSGVPDDGSTALSWQDWVDRRMDSRPSSAVDGGAELVMPVPAWGAPGGWFEVLPDGRTVYAMPVPAGVAMHAATGAGAVPGGAAAPPLPPAAPPPSLGSTSTDDDAETIDITGARPLRRHARGPEAPETLGVDAAPLGHAVLAAPAPIPTPVPSPPAPASPAASAPGIAVGAVPSGPADDDASVSVAPRFAEPLGAADDAASEVTSSEAVTINIT